MVPARTLPQALWHWARETPEEPWLFHPRGADWKWLSFAEVAAGTSRLASALAAAAQSRVERVEFGARPTPDGVALDLAVQGLGWTSGPGDEGATVLLPAGIAVTLPALAPGRRTRATPLPSAPSGAGPAVVRDEVGERRVGQEELAALAAGIDAALPPAGARDVVVFQRPLCEPGARALLAWATCSGAALLLQPDPAQLAASVLWSRPTVVAGRAAELAGVRAALAGHEPRPERLRRRRGPLGRLRAVIALDAAADWPSGAEASFWRGVGAALAVAPR